LEGRRASLLRRQAGKIAGSSVLRMTRGKKSRPAAASGIKKARHGAFHTGRALQADAVSPSGRGGEVLAD